MHNIMEMSTVSLWMDSLKHQDVKEINITVLCLSEAENCL